MARMRSPRLTPVGFVLLGLAVLGTPPAQGASEPEVLSQIETIRLSSDTRSDLDFDSGWRFSQGDFPSAPVPAFQDTKWRIVNLPHDWSIEGPFGPEYASGNGYAAGGVGWYRKHFRTDASVGGKLVRIEFDGVYNHAEVWINGQFIGERPYGYSSFECDLTPHLKAGSGENVVAVRVDHSRFADSRWYTGSGIYRHVRLRITDKLRVAHWGTFVTSPEVTADRAVLQIETAVENDTGARREFSLQSEILTPDGQVAGALTTTNSLDNATNLVVTQRITIQRPQLWSLDAPHQYTLRSRLSTGSALVDQATTQFGIRTLRFDPDNGFFLNDQPLKLKGVCVHHEAGCLGAAVPEKVWERRLRTLKEMGVNAIRTSHNPPAPEFLDLCDRLGLLVKDEAFDEFTPAKNKWVSGRNNGQPARFGYAEDFAEWSERDIADMVRRDRNHPSVIMWSIGNELDYGNDPFSHPALGSEYHPENPSAENLVKMARPLIRAVKQLDSTRPVTAALATVAMSDAVGLPDLLDVVGYNYQESRYPADHARHPRRFIFGSETSHQYRDWAVVRDNDYVAGQFLWTGIDYLGEANRWPNRGSGAGLLDLCGFKKPLAWFRQSLWSDKAMVYLCTSAGGSEGGRFSRLRVAESWNWPTNATVTVRCYTTCPEVRLTLNGTIIGVKHLTNAVDGALSWEVPFAPGELKAIGLAGDKSAAEYALKTAGAPSRIELLPDTRELSADGRDICHVEFRVVDAQGTRVPDAANEVTFDLDGPAKLPGIENGDLNSPVDYTSHNRKAFHGRGLAIVQSAAAAGTITLRATSPGLESASVTISSVTRANATR